MIPMFACLPPWGQVVTLLFVVLGVHTVTGWLGTILGTIARHIIKGY